MKLASLSLAALLVLCSTAFAQTPQPPAAASCFPVGVTVATSPAKESQRLEGDMLAKFRAGASANLKSGSDMLPADADLVILFKVNDNITAFAIARGGCTLGTGVLPNGLLNKILGKADDSI